MLLAFKERHEYLVEALNQIPGFKCLHGDGTFYAFPKVSEVIANIKGVNNDLQLAEYLLNEAEVAVVPGSAFGAENYIRLSFATSLEVLKEAVARISKAVSR